MDHTGLRYLPSGPLQNTFANPCTSVSICIPTSSFPLLPTQNGRLIVTGELGKAEPAPAGGEPGLIALEEEGGCHHGPMEGRGGIG